jgi:hypothetical protein
LTPTKQLHDTAIGHILIIAARRARSYYGGAGAWLAGVPEVERGRKMTACQRFLEAHGPEYAEARAANTLPHVILTPLRPSGPPPACALCAPIRRDAFPDHTH